MSIWCGQWWWRWLWTAIPYTIKWADQIKASRKRILQAAMKLFCDQLCNDIFFWFLFLYFFRSDHVNNEINSFSGKMLKCIFFENGLKRHLIKYKHCKERQVGFPFLIAMSVTRIIYLRQLNVRKLIIIESFVCCTNISIWSL